MIRSTSIALVFGLSVAAFAAPLPPGPEKQESAEILKLRSKQVELSQLALDKTLKEFAAGRVPQGEVTLWSERWLRACLAVAANREERLAAFAKHIECMKTAEEIVKEKVNSGRRASNDLMAASYHRIGAQILLLEEEAKPSNPEAIRNLRKEQIVLAEKGLEIVKKLVNAPFRDFAYDIVPEWHERLHSAQIKMAESREERLVARQKYLDYCKDAVKESRVKLDAGRIFKSTHAAVAFDCIEAEIKLLEEEAKPNYREAVLKLRKDQIELVKVDFDTTLESYNKPPLDFFYDDELSPWLGRLLSARLGVATSREERVAACKMYLEYYKKGEKLRAAAVTDNKVWSTVLTVTQYDRLEAEIQLLKEEGK